MRLRPGSPKTKKQNSTSTFTVKKDPPKSTVLSGKIKSKDRLRMGKKELVRLLEEAEEELFQTKTKLEQKSEKLSLAHQEIHNIKGKGIWS